MNTHGVFRAISASLRSTDQLVGHAETLGQGQEQGQAHELIKPMIEGIRWIFKTSDEQTQRALKNSKITTDTGFRAHDPRFKNHNVPNEGPKKGKSALHAG